MATTLPEVPQGGYLDINVHLTANGVDVDLSAALGMVCIVASESTNAVIQQFSLNTAANFDDITLVGTGSTGEFSVRLTQTDNAVAGRYYLQIKDLITNTGPFIQVSKKKIALIITQTPLNNIVTP